MFRANKIRRQGQMHFQGGGATFAQHAQEKRNGTESGNCFFLNLKYFCCNSTHILFLLFKIFL